MYGKGALRGWRQTVANHGWSALPAAIGNSLRWRLTPAPTADVAPQPSLEQHPFDAEYDVDTDGVIWGGELSSGSRNDVWSTLYYGTAPSVFHSAINHLPTSLREAATFVDLGSGKGRAMMMAAQAGFPRVVGVEITPELHRVATDNLAKFRARFPAAKIDAVQMDAAAYRFPPGPLVVYFFNPFCRPVFESAVRNLRKNLADAPRDGAIVYVNPQLRHLLDREPWLERIYCGPMTLDGEDRQADRFGVSAEDCAIYRFRH